MPCNAKVVLTAKVNINTLDKYKLNLKKLANGNSSAQLNALVSIEVDPQGNATLRYTGLSWDEGTKMLGNAVMYLKKLKVEVSDVGKPETHRHDDPQAHAQTGVTH